MTQLKFTKMHGLGNDFIVFDGVRQNLPTFTVTQLQQLADRHTGIGCDQILLVEPPPSPDIDFTYRIFNADGGEVQQCGNGARCFARFVREQGLSHKNRLAVATLSGVIYPHLNADGQVCVDMGKPHFSPESLPFIADNKRLRYSLQIDDTEVNISIASMGNPHAVLEVADVDSAPVTKWGALLEQHPRFPQRCNIGFMQIINKQHIRLRVYERGSGETLACGTGACAAAACAMRLGLVDTRSGLTVSLSGGDLLIHWQGEGHSIKMTGPALSVFEGVINL